MGPYYIPRNVKDEGRILFIFTGKSLIYTAIGAGIGIFFNLILSALGVGLIGMILIAIFEIILRSIKFKKSNNKIYVYNKEDTKDE